ncbi:ABC transporter permease [Alienimonas californiensis]|uniref:Macrolide export ATP-binding/permease protein MacB n=1 Tax=Alienimonas californiensis TaxID=2527989 RepID=A0A517P449_9PLAN|nr:ABC transporter permease [Alienimonas californiensis]QDT14123.1 Macrolide export ATP-binding/permease protein MacB [Alienimonas californiensis]
MSPFAIAFKSVKNRALVTGLTALSVALGTMLVVAVLSTSAVVDRALSKPATPFDLILGPKGSDLQLVLTTLYRMPAAMEPLPYPYYQQIQADDRFAEAVPIAFGDTTQEGGFPIVATINRFFLAGVNRDEPFRMSETDGSRGFSGESGFEAVVGSEVARANNWGVGDSFKLVHGGADDPNAHVHDELFEIVGVLLPTGTANDQTAFVQLNGFYAVSGHDKPLSEGVNRWRALQGLPELEGEALKQAEREANVPGVGGTPDLQKEVSAIFVNVKGDREANMMVPMVAADINEGFKAAAVNPAGPVARLRETFLAPAQTVLVALSALVVVVAGVGIFVSLYTTLSERLTEVAVLRALGAQRSTVFAVILLEAAVVTLLGGLLGFFLGHALTFAVLPFLPPGLVIDPWAVRWEELWLLPGLALLAALAGLLPATRAYGADVTKYLN